MTTEHYAGELGNWNTTRSGLIPCKVLEVFINDRGHKRLKIRLTGNGRPYKRGEVHEVAPCFVYPRSKVKKLPTGWYLFANYEWWTIKETKSNGK